MLIFGFLHHLASVNANIIIRIRAYIRLRALQECIADKAHPAAYVS